MKPSYTFAATPGETPAATLRCRCCGAVFEDGDPAYRANAVSCCSKACARATITAQAIEDLDHAVQRLTDVMRRAR